MGVGFRWAIVRRVRVWKGEEGERGEGGGGRGREVPHGRLDGHERLSGLKAGREMRMRFAYGCKGSRCEVDTFHS